MTASAWARCGAKRFSNRPQTKSAGFALCRSSSRTDAVGIMDSMALAIPAGSIRSASATNAS